MHDLPQAGLEREPCRSSCPLLLLGLTRLLCAPLLLSPPLLLGLTRLPSCRGRHRALVVAELDEGMDLEPGKEDFDRKVGDPHWALPLAVAELDEEAGDPRRALSLEAS